MNSCQDVRAGLARRDEQINALRTEERGIEMILERKGKGERMQGGGVAMVEIRQRTR